MSQAGALSSVASNPNIPTTFNGNTGSAVPVANQLNVIGSNGVNVQGGGSTLTISLTQPNTIWLTVTSADNFVYTTGGRGYIAKGASPVYFFLPTVAAVGDVIYIEGATNRWQAVLNAGQTAMLGTQTATTGLLSSDGSDGITLLCVTANTDFKVISVQGNIQVI